MNSKKNEKRVTSRRELLKGAAAGAVGVVALGLSGCGSSDDRATSGNTNTNDNGGGTTGTTWAETTPEFMKAPGAPTNVSETLDCDVLVIGCGPAGICAARAAAEAGAKVVAIDKASGIQATGGDYGVIASKIHTDHGITFPSKATIVGEELKEMGHRPSGQLWNHWYDNSGADLDWFLEGADYDVVLDANTPATKEQVATVQPFQIPGYDYREELYPFYYGCINFSPPLFPQTNTYEKAVAAGATFRFGTWGEQLITSGGAVVGAYAHDAAGNYLRINAAKGVVLSTGDVGGDAEMVAYYARQVSDFTCLMSMAKKDANGNAANTGDGHKMGLWAGAAMERPPFGPMTHNMGSGSPVGPAAFLVLNADGERFYREDIPPQQMQNVLSRQPGGVAYQIFDANWKTQLGVQPMGHGYVNYYVAAEDEAKYATALGRQGYVTEETFLSSIGFKADTLDDLITQLGLPKETALASITRYNALCAAGEDADFGKLAKRMFPVSTGPFYAHQYTQTVNLVLMGGLMTDAKARVLDASGKAIQGLYCAGNVMGQRFNGDYPIPVAGVSQGMCVTFGRLAGRSAATGA